MRRERGVALITAILVVAVVATVAAYMSLGQQVWLRQTQNFNDTTQAEAVSVGAVNLAAVLLALDTRADADYLEEPWAQALPTFPVEGGVVTATVSDAQGRFNINNLAQPTSRDTALFRYLLSVVKLDPNSIDAVMDWIDSDATPRAMGAEDDYYGTLPAPYRAANQPFASVDELRLVKGFTPEAVRALRPFLVALPASNAKINVNTASKDVLAALLPAVDVSSIEQFLRERGRNPVVKCAEEMKARFGQEIDCSATTEFFDVIIDTEFGRVHRRTQALLQRKNTKEPATILWQRRYYDKDIRIAPAKDDEDRSTRT